MKKIMCLLLTCWLVYAGSLQAAPGEFWELTSKMDGMGMSMPERTSKECLPLKDEGDPAGVDKSCKVTDLKRIPNGASWKMSCQDGTTGSGTQTRTKDTMTGDIVMNTSDGSMKINMKGKRVGGSCDTGAKAKTAMAEAAKSCDLSGKGAHEVIFNADAYTAKGSLCAGNKDQFCSLVKRDLAKDTKTYAAYDYQKKNAPNSNLAEACGLNPEASRQTLCKSNANDRSASHFLDQYCPGEAKALHEKIRHEECAGRSYTSASDKAKCMSGLDVDSETNTSAAGSSSTSAPASNQNDSTKSDSTSTDAVDQGKKALKGLKDVFGF